VLVLFRILHSRMIGSHACWLEASNRVADRIPLVPTHHGFFHQTLGSVMRMANSIPLECPYTDRLSP
jgi:hypothetical protein